MKLLSNIFISIIFFLAFFIVPTFSQQKESAIVFWGVGCPHCETLKEDIAKNGLEKIIKLDYLEIFRETKYLDLFDEKVAECNIDPQQAGVPLVYRNGKCATGNVDGLALLQEGFDAELLNSIKEPDAKPDTDNKVVDGKQNTLYMIIGVVFVLVAIVAIGLIVEKKRNQANVLIFLLTFSTIFMLSVNQTYAICPVCTVAVGAGLGVSRYFGIDDVITSLWLGGLVMSTIFWTLGWLEKKGWNSKWIVPATYLGMIALVLVPLYFMNMFNPLNALWGVNKVLLGMVIGGLAFWSAAKLHFFIKSRNNHKVYFPFQKVIIPVSTLLLLTIIFYLIIY